MEKYCVYCLCQIDRILGEVEKGKLTAMQGLILVALWSDINDLGEVALLDYGDKNSLNE